LQRALLAALLILCAVAANPPRLGAEGRPVAGNPTVFAVETRSPMVALTFDDGPNPEFTPEILALLSRYHASATFFVLGVEARAYPRVLREIVAQGSEVESHNYNHANLTPLPADAIRHHVVMGAEAIRSVLGEPPRFFRPPYGNMSSLVRSVITSEGETPVLWDLDTRDWSRPGSARIVARVLDHVQAGDIVLFHDGGGNRSETVDALKVILPALQERGLRPVTVRTLLASGRPVHAWLAR